MRHPVDRSCCGTDFMRSQARVLASKTVFSGKLVQVKVDRIVEPGGITARREVVCHGGSVVLLPRIGAHKVLLVRQYRYAAGQPLWELAAGGIEPDETPLEAAARELAEETGYRAHGLRPILRFFPSPGILTEEMHLFEADGLTRGARQTEPDERIRCRAFSTAEMRKMIVSGRIKDGKTLIGVLWLLGGRK